MNKTIVTFFTIASIIVALSEPILAQPDSVYLFSYFKGNGEDGLHLAYSRDGLQWHTLNDDRSFLTPTVGEDKLMRDPCIIRGSDGYFHMVFTTSWNSREIGYTRSKDLIHWSAQRAIPVMAHEPTARNSWAPEVTQDPQTGEYLIYWSSTIPGRFTESTRSEDDYNHRIYSTTTSDFETFSPTALLYDQGFNSIDANIVYTGSRFAMFIKNEGLYPPEKNVRIAYGDRLIGPYGPTGPPITGNYWAEGPTALRIGNRWLVYFDKYKDGAFGAVSSTDFEHWEDISDRVSFPDGIRHGTAFSISIDEFEVLKQYIRFQASNK